MSFKNKVQRRLPASAVALRPAARPSQRRALLAALAGAAAMLSLIVISVAPGLATAAGSPALFLRLRAITFDPLSAPSALPPSVLLPAPDGGRQPYIVQMNGPVDPAWPAQIAAGGAEIVDYLPDYSYLVMVDGAGLARLRSLAFVRWTGNLQPGWRIDPALAGATGTVTVTLIVAPGSNVATLAGAIEQAGGAAVISGVSPDGGLLEAQVSSRSLGLLAAQPSVLWVEPQRRNSLRNEVGRGIIDVTPVWNSHGLRGKDQIIAIADTGLDNGIAAALNRDFRGRLVSAHALGGRGVWDDPHGHGTHVAGSAAGSGANSGSNAATGDYENTHAGIAPEAGLVIQSVLDAGGGLGGIPGDVALLLQQAYNDGARIHSDSWGVALADDGYVYDAQARQVDRFLWLNPDMTVLFAAGNDGEDDDEDGAVDLGSVTTPATAKNVLTIGASENVRLSGGYNSGGYCSTYGGCWYERFEAEPLAGDRLSNNASGMAAFSSRGPAPDGRLKPDLVAPGTNILSDRSSLAPLSNYWGAYDDYYAYQGGTSSATPLAAGAAAIVRQYYETLHAHDADAALVKATLLAGAIDITPGQYSGRTEIPAAPNNVAGWGRLDLGNALFPVPPRRTSYVENNDGLATGQVIVYTYTIASADVPLRVMLTWTDYPGSLLAGPIFVNDLDLRVVPPQEPGISLPIIPDADHVNNVEGAIVANPQPGVYHVIVQARNVPFGPQPFALVVSGALASETARPVVSLDRMPGFAAAGAPITVTWNISGGAVITSSSVLWDTQSHLADRAYGNALPATADVQRFFTATLAMPQSGTLYLAAQAWVDGQQYFSDGEQAINAVSSARSFFLPIVMTYPAPAPTPTPRATTTPALVVQLIKNGGFEDSAPQSPPWQQTDQADPSTLLVSDFWPRNGRWSAWLGGVYSDQQQVYQTVAAPAGTTDAALLFHWYMNSEDDRNDAHDILSVRLLNAAGEPLATLLQHDNTSRRDAWVTTSYQWAGDFPYGGQTIRISFEMATNETLNTNLFVDDVSFVVSAAPIDGAQGVTETIGR